MDRDDLISSLRLAGTGNRETTAFCPSEDEIAGYTDSVLDAQARSGIERHLADCSACLSRIALLGTLESTDSITQTIPDTALARARNLAAGKSRRWWRPAWAAAASVLVASLVVVQWSGENNQPQQDAALPDRQTRAVTSRLSPPEVLAPATEATIEAGELLFRWSEVPDSLYYKVHIVTAAGDQVSERQVAGTQWRAGGELALQPGEEYFLRVDAYLSDGKRISSEHLPFSVTYRP